jgi:hypothetical protein
MLRENSPGPILSTMFTESDREDFVHTQMNSVGLECVDNLIHQIVDDWIQRLLIGAPTQIGSRLVAIPTRRRFTKLWVMFKKGIGAFVGRLVSQGVKERDQADPVFFAEPT